MPHKPSWLTTLIRVRDHHRDCALQALAESLNVSKIANDATQSTTKKISGLTRQHQESAGNSRINVAQLQELRTTRDGLQADLAMHQKSQKEADLSVQKAQKAVSIRDSEREVLIRLSERYELAQRVMAQRKEEQILSESVVTLCNRERST